MKALSTTCPRCGQDHTVRIAAKGVLERTAKVFYLYPFRCKICDARFRAFKYGVKYIRRDVDRRQFQRVDVVFPIVVSMGDNTAHGTSLDVSANGVRLKSDHQFAEGDVVTMNLNILNNEAPLKVDAAIVRSAQDERAGIEFLQMDPMARKNLARFIEQQLSEFGPPSALTG